MRQRIAGGKSGVGMTLRVSVEGFVRPARIDETRRRGARTVGELGWIPMRWRTKQGARQKYTLSAREDQAVAEVKAVLGKGEVSRWKRTRRGRSSTEARYTAAVSRSKMRAASCSPRKGVEEAEAKRCG